MILRYVFVFFAFVGFMTVTKGQSTRDVNTPPKPPSAKYQAVKKEKKGFFLFRKKKKQQTGAEEIAAFRKRIEKNLEAKAREQRKADKPQYTDPLYFGHKKPPKKRKNGKKKFCKECGMSH